MTKSTPTTTIRTRRLATAAVAGLALGIGAIGLGSAPAQAADPTEIDLSAVAGDAPDTAYLEGSTLHFPGGETVEISKKAHVSDLATIGDNLAVVHGDSSPRLDIYAPNGDHVAGHDLQTSSIGVDETNTLLAFVGQDSETVVLDDGGINATELPSAGADHPVIGGVEGSAGTDATVAINDDGTSHVVTAHGTSEEFAYAIHDINDEHEHVATLSVDEENYTTTSGVTYFGDVTWEQDDYTVTSLSPDDSLVLGGDNYSDGAGDRSLAVLDAISGDVVSEFAAAEDVALVQVVWEDDENVLVTATPEADAPDAQQILRVNVVDGTVETALSSEKTVTIAD